MFLLFIFKHTYGKNQRINNGNIYLRFNVKVLDVPCGVSQHGWSLFFHCLLKTCLIFLVEVAAPASDADMPLAKDQTTQAT
jgi:hypothetical protein